MKKFKNGEVVQAPYGDIAEEMWGDWNIVWEAVGGSYQGDAHFILEKDGRYVYFSYSWGSCPCCDQYAEDPAEAQKDMAENALYLEGHTMLFNWYQMLEERLKNEEDDPDAAHADMAHDYYFDCSTTLGERVKALREHLGL